MAPPQPQATSNFLPLFRLESAHVHKHYHAHWCTEGAAGLLLRCPRCQSGPAVPWHPSPWRQLIASPDGNRAVKATISPPFQLLTPAIAIILSSAPPPFCPHPCSFHIAITPFLFTKTPKSEGRKKKRKPRQILCFTLSRDCHSRLRAQRYYHGLPADLNPNLKRRISILPLSTGLAVGAKNEKFGLFLS